MTTLRNRTTGDLLAQRIVFAKTPLERIIGLLPRTHVGPDEGLWFDHCQAVHTLGMRALVDLIFLDKRLRIARVEHAVRPGRPLIWCREAASVLEMGYGFLARRDVLIGDLLAFDEPLAALDARRSG
jgi:uncharacterized protein